MDRGSLQRLISRAGSISDLQLFALTMAWVIAGGLVLQFVVLPYVIPQMHWGHGLIAGLDWTAFHNIAMEQYEKIRQQGWSAWELRPQGQFPSGVVSALYVLIYPEPWVMLPINGALFAAAVVAIRRVLAVIYGSSSMAALAVLPFFAFASFVPIWGQLHKDVISGAGLSLVLTALVLARNTTRETVGFPTLAAIVAGGMGLVWLARPYAVFLVLAATLAFVAPAIFGRSCQRLRLGAVAMVVGLAALSTIAPWSDGKSMQPMAIAATPPPTADPDLLKAIAELHTANDAIVSGRPTPPAPLAGSGLPTPSTESGSSVATPPVAGSTTALPRRARWHWPSIRLPRTRRLPPELLVIQDFPRNYASCAPAPATQLLDRMLFSMCMAREGFKSGGEHGGSNHDYEIRMRSLEDLAAYSPRVVQLAVLEPWPNRWGTEKSDIGRLATYVVPFEMLLAYGAFVLAIVFGARRLARADVWGVVAFCLTYTAFFVYTTPNMGTVYRMRAYTFAIIVSMALGAFLTRSRARLRKASDLDSADGRRTEVEPECVSGNAPQAASLRQLTY